MYAMLAVELLTVVSNNKGTNLDVGCVVNGVFVNFVKTTLSMYQDQ